MQLVAYGAQDIYLTGNPQITFFKVVYRRHTNFSMEEIAQSPNGSVGFDQTASFTISRNGDLIHKMYFEFSPNKMFEPVQISNSSDHRIGIASYIGNTILKEVEIEIGGQLIDRHYSHWLSTWADLTEYNPTGEISQISTKKTTSTPLLNEPGGITTGLTHDHFNHNGTIPAPTDPQENSQDHPIDSNESGMSTLGGKPTLFQKMSFNHLGVYKDQGNDISTGSTTPALFGSQTIGANNRLPMKAYVPLRFWFNRNPGLSLPLIALQYHEVKVNISFCSSSDIIYENTSGAVTNPPVLDGKLWTQYIYLDTDERRRFAQVSHEYLIEQLQFQSEGNSGNYTLNFNHPVKEIIWGGKPTSPFRSGTDNTSKGCLLGNGFLSPFRLANTSTLSRNENGNLDAISGREIHTVFLNTNNCGGAISRTDTATTVDSPSWILKLNGHDRFEERHTTYFSRKQICDYHTGYGGVANRDCILVYSFALKPEEHQPSGTCNFSRIDTAQLNSSNFPKDNNDGVNIYAVNYNVLRIMSGMGGLAYSN